MMLPEACPPKLDEDAVTEPIKLNEQPAPEIKTAVVSEVTFTKDQLVELLRTHYGAEAIPHVKVEADALYGCGKLCSVKFTWSTPNEKA